MARRADGPFCPPARECARGSVVIRLAKIDRAADLRVHFRAAKLLGGRSSGRWPPAPGRSGEKKPAAFGHQDVVAHHGQIGAARDAHAHDRRDLRNAHGAHDGVVAKYAAEIVGIGENIFLQGQKNAGGIHQVNRGNAIFDGDILRANYFFRGHRKERAGLYGCVIGDDHYQPACHTPEAGDRARSRRAAPFLHTFHVRRKCQARRIRISGSISWAIRSRAVRRPFLCCDSMAFAPPPWRILLSSFLISVRRSIICRLLV